MMRHVIRPAAKGCTPIQTQCVRFARDEDGVVTALACFIIVMMLLVGGIGVDLMRNEMERVRVQNTADRAVLAAADMEQDLDPTAVVNDYFVKSGLEGYTPTVTVNDSTTERSVVVNTLDSTPTRFMRFMGVDQLPVPVNSAAVESVNKVEVSLVLDISGSMNDNNKIGHLKQAAKDFIDTMVNNQTKDRVSVTLIPYSEHVNPGRSIAAHMNVNYVHNYGNGNSDKNHSNCLEFPDIAFQDVEIDLAYTYNQVQHFQWNYTSITEPGNNNSTSDTVCPRHKAETITPFSQNAAELRQQINSLAPRAGTAIYLGMKWAAGMLDPAFQPLNAQLSADGIVDPIFANRPVAYSDSDTIKTVVLMTDGMNSNSSRIRPEYYNTVSHVEHWNRWNFQRFMIDSSIPVWWDEQVMNRDLANQLLYNVCDAAKDAGIVVWTIGYDIDDPSAAIMQNCASSPSHFFRVGVTEIADAFGEIAGQLQQLRLTQ